MVLIDSVKWIFGCYDDELTRKKQRLAKQCAYELISSSLPVFIASGVSNLVTAIIKYISDHSANKDGSEVGQSFVYALLMYLLGKYYSNMILQHEINPTENKMLIWLEKNRLDELARHFFAENTAFACKDFLVMFVLKKLYEEYGFGPAFGGLVLWTVIFIVILLYSKKYNESNIKNATIQEELVHYDLSAFSLCLAFVFTALWALGSDGIGFRYIKESSYLYSWQDDDSTDDFQQGNSYFYLYASFITFLTAVILMLEDRLAGVSIPESSSAKKPAHSEGLIDHHESKSNGEILSAFFHEFLGYLCGVAWFVLILDNFLPIGGNNVVGHLIIAFVITVLITYKGPQCMAGIMIKQEEIELKMKKRKEQIENSTTLEERSKFQECWDSLMEYYAHYSLHRKATMNIAVKLTVGWTWEIFVFFLFQSITDSNNLSEAANVAFRLGVALAIIILSVIVYYYFLKYASPGNDTDQEAAEREMASNSQGQENTNPSVNNPLAESLPMDRNL